MLCSADWPARGLVAALSLGFAVLLAGCGPSATAPPSTASTATPIESSPSSSSELAYEPGKTMWETCYSSFTPSGNAEGDLARLVRDCGTTGGMRAVTSVKVGSQGSQDPVDRYAFQVPAPDKCYRIYATGDASVKDLDLLLRGPSGESVVADVTHDAWPVVPP